MKTCNLLVSLAAVLVPAVASADLGDEIHRYGVSVSAGGGLVQFIDPDLRGFVEDGGGWEGRLGFGTKTPLAFEAAYVGSLHAIDALGVDAGASLLGTAVEGNVRVNLLGGNFQPYLLAGAGWARYSLVNGSSNTSDVANEDSVIAFPMGLGLSLRQDQLTLDLRAVYRETTEADMFETVGAGLASWSATLRVGFEY